jgi:hypothetical protein
LLGDGIDSLVAGLPGDLCDASAYFAVKAFKLQTVENAATFAEKHSDESKVS